MNPTIAIALEHLENLPADQWGRLIIEERPVLRVEMEIGALRGTNRDVALVRRFYRNGGYTTVTNG